MKPMFDVAIIGGGINGCGCAADAALRGLSVVLFEQDDLASKTSSSSTKLIHGGLRYLEQLHFSLVKKSLNERQKLLQLAPHLVHPISFVLPYQKNMRPLWMLRAGLFLYDHLSFANTLPHSTFVQRKKHALYFEPLNKHFNQGFLFFDAATDDARLTLANALQAKKHGATLLTHTQLVHAEVIGQHWQLSLQKKSGEIFHITSKTIINTAGPWVENVGKILSTPMMHSLSFIKGSHMVVPKLYEGEHAYLLQHEDQRIIFTIPYHGHTMVGTTDVAYTGGMDHLHIDDSEINYLCHIINKRFNILLEKEDILTTWSGIRPLLSTTGKTPSTLSRDYLYEYSKNPAPVVTVYGGKITTYRRLAEHAVNELCDIFPHLTHSRTSFTPLPGAVFDTMSFAQYQTYAHNTYPWLDKEIRDRYLQTYGTRTEILLTGRKNVSDLGICFHPTLYQAEIDYLINEEWASSDEDILWRRTKLGLRLSDVERKTLRNYLCSRPSKQ